MNYSKGISWIDDVRIPYVDEGEMKQACKSDKSSVKKYDDWNRNLYNRLGSDTKGRFPANILVSDDALNDGSVSKQSNRFYTEGTGGQGFYGVTSNGRKQSGDKGTNSRYYDIDKWFDNLIDVE
jgi:hypothetical protein